MSARLSAGHARSMAETLWGRGGTRSVQTNRRGAFFFSCARHGGYIIDGRCLSETEHKAVSSRLRHDKAQEYFEPDTGRVRRFLSPFARPRTYTYRMAWDWRDYDVFVAEEDADWALVHLMTGIRPTAPLLSEEAAFEKALATFKANHSPTAHELIAIASARRKTDIEID